MLRDRKGEGEQTITLRSQWNLHCHKTRAKQQRETSRGAKSGFYLRHRNSRKASKFGGVLMHSKGWKVQLTEVWAEEQLQLFSRINAPCFVQITSCLQTGLWSVIANGDMFVVLRLSNSGLKAIIELKHTARWETPCAKWGVPYILVTKHVMTKFEDRVLWIGWLNHACNDRQAQETTGSTNCSGSLY